MQGSQLWLCILLGLLCSLVAGRVLVERDADSVAAQSHARDEAEAATYLSKENTNGDASAAATRESEIHPFRVALKHGASQPIALEKTEKASPDHLMRYFEKAQVQSKNAGRRQQEMKMKASAQKRMLRQQQAEVQSSKVTPIPVEEPAVAVEESAKKVQVVASHPHLLAFYLEQLANQAAEQAQNVDSGVLAAQDAMVLLDDEEELNQRQEASTGATTEQPPTEQPPAATGPAEPTTTGPATPPAETPATPPAETPATPAETAAATGPATEPPAATGGGETPPAETPADTAGGGGGGAAASTGADVVTNSVVPLSHLQQLQNDLSAVEAEHAARQAELNAELKKQQEETRKLLEQERQGTVGLTVTPILINPEKHLPIDPNNAELYNNAPTDPNMNIKPSVFRKANDLIAEAQGQHAEFVHNMPLECAEPTCTVEQ